MNLELLFPTPVAFFDLGFELTKKEKEFLVGQERRPNEGNQSSVDTYILQSPELKRLADAVQDSVEKYSKDVWHADIEPYVTQSWLNWTKPGQWHHKHAHPNSLYSGVLYVDVQEGRDRITFYNEGYKQMKPHYTEWNRWNSDSWWLPVKNCQIVLFPSSTVHMVETIAGLSVEKERISLAFNTFAKQMGEKFGLTELIPHQS